jgi:hypothetical protein
LICLRADQTTLRHQLQNEHWFLGTVVQRQGQRALSIVVAERDAIKQLRPTRGLMSRDGGSLPWFGKGEMLIQVQRISKKSFSRQGCALN